MLEDHKVEMVKAWLRRSGRYLLPIQPDGRPRNVETLEATVAHRARWEHVRLELAPNPFSVATLEGPAPSPSTRTSYFRASTSTLSPHIS
jgi:hypothetical protein